MAVTGLCLGSCGTSGTGIQPADLPNDAAFDESGIDISGNDFQAPLDVRDHDEAQDAPGAPDGTPDVDLPPTDLPADPDADACSPSCGEAECGDDGCGGTCGTCSGGKACTEGRCECVVDAYRACCNNAVCWFDSCGTQGAWIVDCPKGCEASRCADCTAQCQGKACGEDGCGGECGQCARGSCDGLSWTTAGACVNGQCLGGGTQQGCDDGNACTRDACDPRFGCGHEVREDGFVCEEGRCDNLFWSRPRTCVGDACNRGGETLSCQDGNPCTEDACDALAGCIFTPNTLGCDDSDPCTTGDACKAGLCQGTGSLDCDDRNPCTTDSCIPGQGCRHANLPDGAGCGPGNCSGLTFTQGASCIGGACAGTGDGPRDCDDGRPCTLDQCDAQAGCRHDVIDGYCLIEGACQENGATRGACLTCSASKDKTHWTSLDVCDDARSCTTDSCDTGTGECRHNLASEHCLIDDTCHAAGGSGTNPCLVCSPASGTLAWSYAADGTDCGGGNRCQAGQCLACTTETCNGLDDDCDSLVDEEGAEGCVRYYKDADHDGSGDPANHSCLCAPTGDYTLLATAAGDCCDSDAAAKPGVTAWYTQKNLCDSWDYDCSGHAEKRDSAFGKCGFGPDCAYTGGWFVGTVPDCGVEKEYLRGCIYSFQDVYCLYDTVNARQGCH